MNIKPASDITSADSFRAPTASEINHLLMLGDHELQRGRLAEALILYRFIKAIAPDHIEAAARYALTLFRREQWDQAWDAFDIRFRLMPSAPRVTTRDANGKAREVPRWRGGPVPTKLLVMDEQGLGDTIQFARFLKPLVERGVDVSFVTHPSLFTLLQSMELPVRLIPSNEPGHISGVGGWTPLINLPRALAIAPEDYAAHEPYLKADPKRVKQWAKKLNGKAFKIGLVWAGNANSPAATGRSIPLETLAPLARIPNIRLYALQKGEAAQELKSASFKKSITDFGDALDAGDHAFLDTAAIIQSLDLVVSVDTAIAHLAGALGKPVCLLLRKDPDWRWLAREEENVWYPKTKLYRQRIAGDWSDPVARIAFDISAKLGKAMPPQPGVMPLVPVPVGELIDRISILDLKIAHSDKPEQSAHLDHHANMLRAELAKIQNDVAGLDDLSHALSEINASLWRIEDEIRIEDQKGSFGEEFVALARSVYQLNDRRSELKRKIDDLAGSRFKDVKTYEKAQNSAKLRVKKRV